MDILWTLAIALCSAILISIGLNPVLIEISVRKGWYAKTNVRTIHHGKIPYIGGVAIFIAFVAGVCAAEIASPFLRDRFTDYGIPLLLFGLSFAAIHYMGLIDDFRNIRARNKLLIQFAAAALLSFTGYNLEGIQISREITVSFGPLSYVITILWFIGTSNAVNFIDGMDGLSGITSSLGALFYGITFFVLGNIESTVLAFALLGSIIGFLLFNWPKAKIFMGNNGALFLGFALAALPFFEHSGIVPLKYIFIPISLLFFPLFDTFMAIGRRIKRRKPVHSPDKEHIHHKLLALGYTQGHILVTLTGAFLLPSVSALAILWTGPIYGTIAVCFGWFTAILFFVTISRRHRKGVLEKAAAK